ncbi:hypothetical protein J3D54_001757 [Pseudomonas sp. GGS8]|uniref:hypothetical protein n=1 Tax=Pseudomonas sp. GGS8 TaxID=2817892 RepID=UPI0020A0D95A|nr:hypothetical protein [Pseudomonas sp. GGS8]MCP1442625.1 hypothetical protein [Pseudomonas sp. GGS8]
MIVLVPKLWAKLCILAAMVGFILLTMLVDNPLRVLFYAIVQGSITLLAILATQVIESRWAQRTSITAAPIEISAK